MEKAIEAGLSEIKKLGLKGDVYAVKSNENETAADEGKIERLKSAVVSGAGVRVFKNGLLGFSYTTDITPEGIKDAVLKASQSAFIEGYEKYSMPGACAAAEVKSADAGYGAITPETRKNTALELESAVKKSDSRVIHVRDTIFRDAFVSVMFSNTENARFTHQKTIYSIMSSAVASDGVNTEVSDIYAQSCALAGLNIQKTALEAGRRAAMILGGESIPTGRYDIILPDYTAADFAYLLSRVFHGGSIAKGKSMLSGIKTGSVIGSPCFTLRDDALLEMRQGSFSHDAEGTPGMNKALIDSGTYKGFISDRLYAAKAGAAPSGNCVRQDFKSLPEPGPSNFYIAGGSGSAEDFLKNATGLFINSLMGLHTADPVSGNFSLGINGWLLERGEKIKSVKECLITGNIKDILDRTVKAAGEPVFYGNCGAPLLYVEGITAAGR